MVWSFFSSSWCRGLTAVYDCGIPWTFLLTFYSHIYMYKKGPLKKRGKTKAKKKKKKKDRQAPRSGFVYGVYILIELLIASSLIPRTNSCPPLWLFISSSMTLHYLLEDYQHKVLSNEEDAGDPIFSSHFILEMTRKMLKSRFSFHFQDGRPVWYFRYGISTAILGSWIYRSYFSSVIFRSEGSPLWERT